jgi:hypothetical protein
MSVARITALALVSSRTPVGRPFLEVFLAHFGGVFGRFLGARGLALRFSLSHSRETSEAICSFRLPASEQEETHSAAVAFLGRHACGLDWGPRGALWSQYRPGGKQAPVVPP